jgi:hypothetical protein
MVPISQPKSRQNLLKQVPRQWSSLTRDRLGIFALALFVLGLILLLLPIGAFQGVGGIVFGTGLTVLVSTWSNRQQLAKDANLRRKVEVYGPLHIELQTLRERLEKGRAGSQPYLQWVDVKGMQPDYVPPLLNEKSPQLYCWQEFKADFRNLDFSEHARRQLDMIQQLAMDYNFAVEQALVASETAFAPCIQAAITRVTQSKEFQEWNRRRNLSLSNRLPRDNWFFDIQDDNERLTHTIGAIWATRWLSTESKRVHRPTTLGWLLTGNRDQSVQAIYSVLSSDYSPLPPLEWLREIVDKAWLTLESDAAYQPAQTLHERLFKQVSQAETRLVDTLRSIQDVYEGGPPPL